MMLLILGASFRYIFDALKTFESNKVVLHVFSEFKAFIITSDDSNEYSRQLVFPIRLPDGV